MSAASFRGRVGCVDRGASMPVSSAESGMGRLSGVRGAIGGASVVAASGAAPRLRAGLAPSASDGPGTSSVTCACAPRHDAVSVAVPAASAVTRAKRFPEPVTETHARGRTRRTCRRSPRPERIRRRQAAGRPAVRVPPTGTGPPAGLESNWSAATGSAATCVKSRTSDPDHATKPSQPGWVIDQPWGVDCASEATAGCGAALDALIDLELERRAHCDRRDRRVAALGAVRVGARERRLGRVAGGADVREVALTEGAVERGRTAAATSGAAGIGDATGRDQEQRDAPVPARPELQPAPHARKHTRARSCSAFALFRSCCARIAEKTTAN